MNEVKRYDAGCDYAGEEEMVERADGDFVRHEDYAALKDSAMDYAYRWGKAQDDIKKAHMLHSMQKEEIANLKEQLTATTNSLTNAQEALKSAGIKADTVQAGVMELKAQRDALAAENAALKTFIKQSCYSYDGDGSDVCDSYVGADGSPFFPKTPATDAYLNTVRADAVEDVAKRLYGQGYNFEVITRFAAQLRSGNAGKDGSHE